MLSSDTLLPGDNTEIQAGRVKKSLCSRQQTSKTGKLNPNRAPSKWQAWSQVQIQQAPFSGQKSTEILLAGLSWALPGRERKGKRGLSEQ